MPDESTETTENNDSLCPCGSGQPIELCCQTNTTSESSTEVPESDSKSFEIILQFGQLFGPAPIIPTRISGKHGAILQFIIPDLDLANEEIEFYTTLMKKCGDEIENTSFQAVTQTNKPQSVEATNDTQTDQNKKLIKNGTLVAVTFHYSMTQAEEVGQVKKAEHIGRLIAERFVGLLSFALGLQIKGINRQTTRVREGNQRTVSLRPKSNHFAEKFKVEIPDELAEGEFNDEIFKAMYWLRRGLVPNDHLAAFGALMVALEVLAKILVESTASKKPCPHCGESIEGTKRPSVQKMFTEVLGGDKALFKQIWKARNAITAHGNKAVTPEVMQSIVKLKQEALKFVYKALKLACKLPLEGNPKPSPLIMMTDTFIGEE